MMLGECLAQWSKGGSARKASQGTGWWERLVQIADIQRQGNPAVPAPGLPMAACVPGGRMPMATSQGRSTAQFIDRLSPASSSRPAPECCRRRSPADKRNKKINNQQSRKKNISHLRAGLSWDFARDVRRWCHGVVVDRLCERRGGGGFGGCFVGQAANRPQGNALWLDRCPA